MLHFQIDPHPGMPVYRQMMNQFRYYVASGLLRAGDQLPSIRAMAKRLAVNPSTVVKAYTELQHEGLIEMKHGRGAFVAENTRRLSEAGKKKALRRLARQLAVEAKQIGASQELLIDIVTEEVRRLNHE